MDYDEFREGIADLASDRQAFLMILFFAGCRVSEALALTSDDISCTSDTIYIQFKRLKGSKQTDPTPIPLVPSLKWLYDNRPIVTRRLFEFHRTTAYRLVKKAFPTLYPHYFRMNRIVKISDKFGDATVYSFVGICAQSIDHYRGKVDIKKVGTALLDEVQEGK